MPSELELAGRLGAALVLGGAIGLERELTGQVAGLRTHMTVALGAALFGIVSAYGWSEFAAVLLSPAQLAMAHREHDEWRVEIRAADRNLAARSRWIVDSTGRPAAFARRSGARLHRFDRLVALVDSNGDPAARADRHPVPTSRPMKRKNQSARKRPVPATIPM